MENTQVATTNLDEKTINELIFTGNVSQLSKDQQIQYVLALCKRYDLDPVTKPFNIINFQGKSQVYANKSTTDQIREKKKLSARIVDTKVVEGIYIAIAEVGVANRVESSTGAVTIKGLSGDMLANAIMKAETKAKRRATLSFMGLSVMDETEVETITNAKIEPTPELSNEGFLNKVIEKKQPEEDRDLELEKAIESIENTNSLGILKTRWNLLKKYHETKKFVDVVNKRKKELTVEQALDVDSSEVGGGAK